MGSTLCLIVIFNHALAYHLKGVTPGMVDGITTTNDNAITKTNQSKNRKNHIDVALQLYNLAIEWQTRIIHQNYYCQDEDESSWNENNGSTSA